MRWEPPACSSVRQRSRWSCGCTRSWACRWRKSCICCGRNSESRSPGGSRPRAAPHRSSSRADLLGVVPAGAEQPRGHPGRDRLARWRSPPLAVGLRHADDNRLCDLCRSRLRRCGDGSRGRLLRGAGSYRRFTEALHQTCLAHLLRRTRHLQDDHPRSRWVVRVKAVLQAALELRDRRDAGGLSDHGLATARGRLLARLARLIAKPSPLEAAERFAAHLAIEFPAVLAFLWHPSVDATNWRAEQAIRPAVVIRKVCGGNRTRHGADSCGREPGCPSPPAQIRTCALTHTAPTLGG